MAQNVHIEFIHISVDVTDSRIFLVFLILYVKQVKHNTCIKEWQESDVLSKARFVTVTTNKSNKHCHYEIIQKGSFTSIGSSSR